MIVIIWININSSSINTVNRILLKSSQNGAIFAHHIAVNYFGHKFCANHLCASWWHNYHKVISHHDRSSSWSQKIRYPLRLIWLIFLSWFINPVNKVLSLHFTLITFILAAMQVQQNEIPRFHQQHFSDGNSTYLLFMEFCFRSFQCNQLIQPNHKLTENVPPYLYLPFLILKQDNFPWTIQLPGNCINNQEFVKYVLRTT